MLVKTIKDHYRNQTAAVKAHGQPSFKRIKNIIKQINFSELMNFVSKNLKKIYRSTHKLLIE